jgi:hypothetical protein
MNHKQSLSNNKGESRSKGSLRSVLKQIRLRTDNGTPTMKGATKIDCRLHDHTFYNMIRTISEMRTILRLSL